MKKRDFIGLGRRLLPNLPGFAVRGAMLFMQPVGQVLRAVHFESSGFDARGFYIWVFIMPLCVPKSGVRFTIGKRVRCASGADGWTADTPNLVQEISDALRSQALPFLNAAGSARAAASVARSLGTANPHIHEALAYCLARAGDVKQAARELDQLLGGLDVGSPWQAEIATRARALKAKLISDPAGAQKLLAAWESETSRNLGLEAFREAADPAGSPSASTSSA